MTELERSPLRTKPRVLRIAVAVVLLALSSGLLRADFKKDFADAVRAFERGNFARAVELLEVAMAQQPEDDGQTVRLAGTRMEPYLPSFYLGRSLVRLEDCAGALRAFVTSEEGGRIQSLPRYHRRLTQERQECAVVLAQAAEDEDGPMTTEPPGGRTTDGSDEGEARIAAAPPEAAPSLEDPSLEDPSLEDPSRTVSSSAVPSPEQRDRIADIGTVEPEARLDPPPPAETERAPEATGRLPSDTTTGGATTPTEPVPTFDPTERLQVAARRFFDADYRGTESLLARIEPDDDQIRLASHVLRAASRFALWARSGEDDPELLALARQDVADCVRLSPSWKPDARFFSPRFLSFFEENS